MERARILIVEDESIVALELRERLLDFGFEPLAAVASGEEAVAVAERERPDLVLMDIKIRGRMDGVDAAKRIRERLDVPVVFLTAYADDHTLERAKITEPDGYILKPFDEKGLHAALTTALYRHRLKLERQRFLEKVVETQEEERRRIARELHDTLGQSLTSVLVRMRRLTSSTEDPGIREPLEEMRRILADTLDEMKRLSRGLHPMILESLGFEAAVESVVEDVHRAHDLQVDLHLGGFDGAPELPLPLATALYRILQEALTNVIRHAEARTASVVVVRRDDSLSLVVEDDGRGLPPSDVANATSGLGLYGIRERVRWLGGSVTLESPGGGGTALFIRIPLPAEDAP